MAEEDTLTEAEVRGLLWDRRALLITVLQLTSPWRIKCAST